MSSHEEGRYCMLHPGMLYVVYLIIGKICMTNISTTRWVTKENKDNTQNSELILILSQVRCLATNYSTDFITILLETKTTTHHPPPPIIFSCMIQDTPFWVGCLPTVTLCTHHIKYVYMSICIFMFPDSCHSCSCSLLF